MVTVYRLCYTQLKSKLNPLNGYYSAFSIRLCNHSALDSIGCEKFKNSIVISMVVFAPKRNLSTFKIYRKQSDTSCFQNNHIQPPSVPSSAKIFKLNGLFYSCFVVYECYARYMRKYEAWVRCLLDVWHKCHIKYSC